MRKFLPLIAACIALLTLTTVLFAQARTGAICKDGTSSAATGRGACSHHGGVARWLTSDQATPAKPTNTPTSKPITGTHGITATLSATVTTRATITHALSKMTPTAVRLPKKATPTATPEPAEDLDGVTAADWVKADDKRRAEITHYFREFWKKNSGEEVAQSEKEMLVCIAEQVTKPETKRTMLIMVLASKCLK